MRFSLAGFAVLAALGLGAGEGVARSGGIGDVCGGGRAGQGCAAGLFCDYLPRAQCGAADLPGQCAIRPRICTREYRPVCGCDGRTYGNDCERRSAGVGKLAHGRCRTG